MRCNVLLIIVLLLIISSSLQSQEIHRRNFLDDKNKVLYNTDNSKTVSHSWLLSESIGLTTNYEYCTNDIYLNSILYVNEPMMVSMVRPYLQSTQRTAVYSKRDSQSLWNHEIVFQPGGFPQIDINLTGNNQGLIGIVDASNRLALKSGNNNFIIKPTPGTGPAFAFSNDKIFLVSIFNQTMYLFRSDDLGNSYIPVDSISHYFSYINSSTYEIFKSNNEQHIVILGISTRNGDVYSGVPEGEADNMWVLYSTNFGANWSVKTIAVDGKINIVPNYHSANFAPLFENFGQIRGCVTDDGVIHIAANGYGLVFDNPTGSNIIGSSFPLLYWNSITENWISVSDPAIDTVQAIGNFYPTNSIGQAYPSISVSDDGQVLYAIWTGPQFTAGQLDTAGNGAVAPVPFYWRDLYHAFSVDGGTNWTYAGKLPLMSSDLSEIFGQAASTLQTIDANSYRAHIKYLADQTTGISVFDGVLTDNEIIYNTYDILVTSSEGNPTINNFELSQNYPNPFNPSTTIQYAISSRQFVSLKVYDVLGNLVATLVDEYRNAGSYEVEFSATGGSASGGNASQLASGIYFYKLQAGSFVQTKKMILLK